MNKTVFFNFFRDKWVITVFYFLNSIILATFFHLSTGRRVELLYPAILIFLVYLIMLFIEYLGYYKFNDSIGKGFLNPGIQLSPSNSEQKAVDAIIKAIHEKYLHELHDIQLKNKTREQFLSQWIHNLKSPVSIINLIMERGKAMGEISLDIANSIQEENLRLQNGLEQILNLLRLGDFSRDFTPEVIDLAASLKKVINDKKNAFIYNNLFPVFQETSVLLVYSDSKWNEVLLEQVISNAIKFSGNSPDQNKKIVFEIKKDGQYTVLSTVDQGIGIPEHDLNRIFEPFFTGENGRKVRNTTGIGLYICSQIAERIGHKISVSSQVGQGTEVMITYLTKM